MFASPVATTKTKTPSETPRRSAPQRPASEGASVDAPTHAPAAPRSPSWDFGSTPLHAPRALEIRGSTQRAGNEAEAERAATSVAGSSWQPQDSRQYGTPKPLPRYAAAGQVSTGRTLPEPARQNLENAFGYSLAPIRLHDDAVSAKVARGMGARAFASGPQIMADGPLNRHVLAHEVAHVIQTSLQPAAPAIHRFESREHKALGDTSLDELQDFLATEAGRKWAKEHGLNAEELLARIMADPLKAAGGKITAGTRTIVDPKKSAEEKKAHPDGKEQVKLSPGEIIALSGDFYKDPDDIVAAASKPVEKIEDKFADKKPDKKPDKTPGKQPGKTEGKDDGGTPEIQHTKNELDKLQEAIEKERKGQLPNSDKAYEEITKGRYLDLAKQNDVHFAPKNRAEWRRLHVQALAEAANAKDDAALQHALLVDAAGGHFLTDAFASGHMFDKGQLVAAISSYLKTSPLRTENPEAQTYAAIISASGNAEQIVLKAIHDRMNIEGFEVTNAAGMKWRTFGDAQLAKAPDTSRIAALAIFESRQQIYDAKKGKKPDPKDVEALMPDDATIKRATDQAIAYIPKAAADAQGVIFRGRSLAPSQFGKIGGTIIQSNLDTIADPGRDKQLLDLKRSEEETNSGPRIAPQFTLGRF